MPSCFARIARSLWAWANRIIKSVLSKMASISRLANRSFTFCVVRWRRALFAEHLPHGHKVAGGEGVPEQNVKLVKVAPGRNAVVEIHVDRRSDKIVGDVHGDLPQVFPQPLRTMHTTRAVKSTLVGWLNRLREPVQ